MLQPKVNRNLIKIKVAQKRTKRALSCFGHVLALRGAAFVALFELQSATQSNQVRFAALLLTDFDFCKFRQLFNSTQLSCASFVHCTQLRLVQFNYVQFNSALCVQRAEVALVLIPLCCVCWQTKRVRLASRAHRKAQIKVKTQIQLSAKRLSLLRD